jgi:hypothetical protein
MAMVVKLRDERSWSWMKISDHVEKLLAKKEGRKPIPRWDQGKRRWSSHRCEMAYKRMKELRSQADKSPDSSRRKTA